MAKTVVVVLAGGSGKRFGLLKQCIEINNKPLFLYTLDTLKRFSIVLTVPSSAKDQMTKILNSHYPNVKVIEGGKTRQESVFNALKYINRYQKCRDVIITEAARPCISIESYHKCLEAVSKNQGAVAIAKSVNTACLKKEDYLHHLLPRIHQYDLLMPQCFRFKYLYEAHKLCGNRATNATDDTQILLNIMPNAKIRVIEINKWEGLKLTHKEDLPIIETLLKEKK